MSVRRWTLAAAATAILAASILAAAPALALSVMISGLWNTNAPITPYSAPLESFSLSFNLPQVYTTIYQDPNLSVTTQMTNVLYNLDGVAVPVMLWTGPQAGCFNQAVGTLCNIAFFDTAEEGGLAMAFSDHVVEFFGPDIGSQGVLIKGTNLSFIPNMDDTNVDEGTALGSVTPEPAAWTMVLLGVFGVGAAARTARRRLAVA